MNLKQAIERTDLAHWYQIYATQTEGQFTTHSKVVDETNPEAVFFASKGFIDNDFKNLSTEQKIDYINKLDKEYPED